MSAPLDGTVLRKARVAKSNSSNTSDPDIVVLDRDSNGSGTSDREEYLTEMVDDPLEDEVEYLVLPSDTGNLIEGNSLIEENPQAINEEETVFQFNKEDYGIVSGSVSVDPAPDSIEEDAGIIIYDSSPNSTPKVTYDRKPLEVDYVRNEKITRFGFNSAKDKWLSLPGKAPEEMGKLPESGLMEEIPEVKEDFDPRIVISSPDSDEGILVPTTVTSSETTFNSYKQNPGSINTGEAVVFDQTGEIQFEQSLIDNHEGKEVYAFQYDFVESDEETGYIGTEGQDVIVLNPLPKNPSTDENLYPLIRAGYGSYLEVNPSSSTTGTEDVIWNVDSGRLTFQTDEFEGEDIYYDGVLMNSNSISSYDSTSLGDIPAVPDVIGTGGIDPINTDKYDEDGIIIYVEETGEVISRVEKVSKNKVTPNFGFLNDPEGFKPSYNLPPDKIQIAENNSGNLEIQLPLVFKIENAGNTLVVGTGDFLLEKGITFRMSPSSNDASNTRGIPDAKASERISDATLDDSIPRGPFISIDQTPITDIPGYDQNQFFKRTTGPAEEVLQKNEDIIHDFDSSQLRWCERIENTHLILNPNASFKLDYEALHPEDASFELDEGQGFIPLKDESNVNIHYDIGKIDFIDNVGEVLGRGSAIVSNDTLETNEIEFEFDPSPSSRNKFNKPVVIVNDELVYRVVEKISSSKIRLHEDLPSSQDRVDFELREAPEVVFRYGFHETDLSKRIVRPWKVRKSPDRVPDGERFKFFVKGSETAHKSLETVVLGTPRDDDGNNNTLYIPSYYRNSYSVFNILRDRKKLTDVSPSSPSNAEEYSVDRSTGKITFHQSMYQDHSQSSIVFQPDLSQNRPTGDIEVLAENREVGLPDDIDREDVKVRVLLRENEYTVQSISSSIFFDVPFRSGEELIVEYTDSKGNQREEQVGFRIKEEVQVSQGEGEFEFGGNKNIDQSRPARVLINGSPVRNANVDKSNKTVKIDPLSGPRRVSMDYHVLQAQGGERNVSLNYSPQQTDLIFEEGEKIQSLAGDLTQDISENDILVVNNQSFQIQSISFQNDETKLELQKAPVDQIRNPTTLVTSEPIEEFEIQALAMEDNSAGDTELKFYGNKTKDILKDHILLIEGDPYHVEDVQFDKNNSVTRVKVTTQLLQEYTDPDIEMTPYKVYQPDAAILEAENLAISGREYRLIRFNEDDEGEVLTPEDQYSFRDDGRVTLNQTNVDLPQIGEYWLLAYVGRDIVEPIELQGSRFTPRLKTSYVRKINAGPDNFMGSVLKGTYTFRSKDSFFFRATPLEKIAGEVSEEISRNLQAGNSSGPVIGGASERDNYEYGLPTEQWIRNELKDKDRVGRRYIEFYHEICNGFENYLQVLDGRVIGDQDGRFKFYRAPYGQRGGEDPVTGELIPYYANPDGSGEKPGSNEIFQMNLDNQSGYIRNSIDDIVLTSKTPYDIDFGTGGISFTFIGTFKKSWRPHRFSRFYPEEANIYTITTPDRDFTLPDPLTDGKDQSADGAYTYLPDYGDLLADMEKEDILSIESVRDRAAKGWIIEDEVENVGTNKVKIKVGMKQNLDGDPPSNSSSGSDGNLKDGWAKRSVPSFSENDIVNLGRIEFDEDQNTGAVEKNRVIYAHNMVITNINGDTIELSGAETLNNVSDASKEFNIATDPDTLIDGNSSSGNYDEAFDTPKKNDTLFAIPQNYYRTLIDVGVNQAEGELKNVALPSFIGGLLGQNLPSPKTYLDVSLSFKNQRMRPRRFPALDGGLIDDDLDNKPPYSYPLDDSEIQSFQEEKDAINQVLRKTSEDLVLENEIIKDFQTISTSKDLLDLDPSPSTFESVIIEGLTDSGSNIEYSISNVQVNPDQITVVAKNDSRRDWIVESGFTYSVSSLYDGTGTKDGSDPKKWNDDNGQDFTEFSGSDRVELHIDGDSNSPYSVTSLEDGYVLVSTNIQTSSGSYHLSMESDTGYTQSDLNRIYDTGIDFSYSSGQFEILTDQNTGVYDIDSGIQDELFPEILDSSQLSINDTVTISIARGTDLTRGTGSRNNTDNTVWEDGNTDFTQFNNEPQTFLNVLVDDIQGRVDHVHVYKVAKLDSGYLETENKINQSGTHDYVLSSTNQFGKGRGAIEISHPKRLYLNSLPEDLNIEKGNKLFIEDTSTKNSGRYEITSIDTSGSTPYVEVNKSFLENSGSPSIDDFPVEWESFLPRRFSPEIENNLRTKVLERFPMYQDNEDADDTDIHSSESQSIKDLLISGSYASSNPSTPSIDVLDEQLTSVMDLFKSDSSAEIGNISSVGEQGLKSSSIDFTELKDNSTERADYILIENGENRGMYQVDEVVNKDELLLAETSLVNTYNHSFTSSLPTETGLEIRIFRQGQFSEKTYELTMYEYINVLEVIDRMNSLVSITFHNPSDLAQNKELEIHYGSPQNPTLEKHLKGSYSTLPIGVKDREKWITDSHPEAGGLSLGQEIDAILNGREKLYDMRYAWIDYRINKKDGTLQRMTQERERKIEEKITAKLNKLRSSI
jgi:hypothetical protein